MASLVPETQTRRRGNKLVTETHHMGESISIPQNKSWHINTTVKEKQHRNKWLGVYAI